MQLSLQLLTPHSLQHRLLLHSYPLMNSSASNTWIHGHQRLTHMLVHYFSLLSFDNTTQSLPLGLIAFILFHQFLLISVSIFVYTMYVVNLPFLVFVLPFFLFSIITLARQHIPKYPPSFLSLFDHITHNRQEIRTYWLYALPAHFQSSTDINISLLPASASSITSCYQYWMSKWVCKTSSSTPMYTASIVLLDYHFTPQLLHFKSFSIIKNTLLFLYHFSFITSATSNFFCCFFLRFVFVPCSLRNSAEFTVLPFHYLLKLQH